MPEFFCVYTRAVADDLQRFSGSSREKAGRSALTVLSVVEGSSHGFARRVVASANAAFVVPGLGVEDVVAARLLRSRTPHGRQNVRTAAGRSALVSDLRCGPLPWKRRTDFYPAEALNADVIRVRPARRAVNDAVLQLVVRRRPGNAAEELAAILHEYLEEERKQSETLNIQHEGIIPFFCFYSLWFPLKVQQLLEAFAKCLSAHFRLGCLLAEHQLN